MNTLIAISSNEQNQPIVSGRELHKFLDVDTPYHKWLPRMAEYGFAEGTDYIEVSDRFVQNPAGGRPATDHAITLDMAKELAMLQRTDKGKQARHYFIQVEKEFNTPEKIMARALQIADAELKRINARLEIAEPKAERYDRLMSSDDCISISDMAKLLKTGQNRLFRFLREQRVLMADNRPYQPHVDAGRFRVIEQTWEDAAKEKHISFKTLVTTKGQEYITKIWNKH